jgi:hypothetical protein
VPAGVGMDFRGVLPNRSHLTSYRQHPRKQRLDIFDKSPAYRSDNIVIGRPVRCYETERNGILGRSLQFGAGKCACGVAVYQNASQHLRLNMRNETQPKPR